MIFCTEQKQILSMKEGSAFFAPLRKQKTEQPREKRKPFTARMELYVFFRFNKTQTFRKNLKNNRRV